MSIDDLENMMVPQPYAYKQFLVWPNTVISVMGRISCHSTPSGVCHSGKTVNECLELAKKNWCGCWIFD